MIESDRFFEGRYTGKVIEIHSNQRGAEKEENVQRLIDLEKPENPIEIVVHAEHAQRGLGRYQSLHHYSIACGQLSDSHRANYRPWLAIADGVRTGVEKVDKLTIIAHDCFQSIVDAADDSSSIIRQENIIEID